MKIVIVTKFLTEALPAVTNPFSLKRVGNFFKDSIVVLGLGCSSTSMFTISFLTLSGTGAISCWNLPASCAVKTVLLILIIICVRF